jgi:hypothetical protein
MKHSLSSTNTTTNTNTPMASSNWKQKTIGFYEDLKEDISDVFDDICASLNQNYTSISNSIYTFFDTSTPP